MQHVYAPTLNKNTFRFNRYLCTSLLQIPVEKRFLRSRSGGFEPRGVNNK